MAFWNASMRDHEAAVAIARAAVARNDRRPPPVDARTSARASHARRDARATRREDATRRRAISRAAAFERRETRARRRDGR